MKALSCNIVQLFSDVSKKHPNRIALIDKDKNLSFSELESLVNQTANFLKTKGLGKDDRILVFVPMGIDLYRIVLAIFSIGATAVFLDEWVSIKRMNECAKLANCKGFIGIFKARLLALFNKELFKIPIHLGVSIPRNLSPDFKIELVDSSDTALITFTTGSIGIPKAAKRTHGLLMAQFDALVEKLHMNEYERSMPLLPIVLLLNLGIGNTSIISNYKAGKSSSIKTLINLIIKHKVTTVVASPIVIKDLSKFILAKNIKLELTKVFTGGAPVFPYEAKLFKNALPSSKIEVIYGSTEAEPISGIIAEHLVNEDVLKAQGLLVGKPFHKTEVEIIPVLENPITIQTESDLNQLTLPEGIIGEIIVAGDHVLQEYFNNNEASNRNKIFINDKCWHRTGDSGFLLNNKLYLTGRCNTLIKWKEGWISSFVYESFFSGLKGVQTGTVLEINSRVVAILQLSDNNQQEIIETIKNADLKIDEIRFIRKMPMDPRHQSKIDYQKLKTIIATTKK